MKTVKENTNTNTNVTKQITIIKPTMKYYEKQRRIPVTFNERRIRGKNIEAFIATLRVGDAFVAPTGTNHALRTYARNSHGTGVKLVSTAVGKLKSRYWLIPA